MSDYADKGATISECGRYRYNLWRQWSDGTRCLFVMLNPSTADAAEDDPTIRRCVGFAKLFGHGSLEVVNLFAFRATNPRDLVKVISKPFHRYVDVIGPDNDLYVDQACARSSRIIAAWGSSAAVDKHLMEYGVLQMRKALEPYAPIWCLTTTGDGSPGHPLYLPSNAPLNMYIREETK